MDDGTAEQFGRLGVAIEGEEQEETMDVLQANWPALKVFLHASTQWRVAQVGGGMKPSRLIYLGLDYAGLDALMRRLRIRGTEVFEDVQLMETAALVAFGSGGEA